MCYLCNQVPCPSACPNATSISCDICSECGADICQGEEFYNLNGNKYHKECVSMLTSTYILKVLKIMPQVFYLES